MVQAATCRAFACFVVFFAGPQVQRTPEAAPNSVIMRQLVLLAFFLLASVLGAQNCFYQLRLEDSRGDGFNGGAVTVSVAGTTTAYTLDAMNDDGRRRDFFFGVDDGDAVTVGYVAGAFPAEVSLSVLDNNDSLIYRVQAPETNAGLTSFTANCRTCAPPPLSSIQLYRVRYNSVDIRFRSVPAAADPTYLIEYGPDNFDPATGGGTQLTTRDTMLRVSGLESSTTYSFYVSTICQSPADTTVRRGPFRIRTQVQKDVGVTVLLKPTDKCAPQSTDSITIGITNFGGEAQQFFQVDFRINGQPGGVNFPFDGVYTGVVGVDSTEYFTFDTRVDLRTPGNYTFEAFTLLEGDENTANDTFVTTVTSVPVIDTLPYFEGFEANGGFWRSERGGRGPSSWQRARPRNTRIDGAGSGEYAYVTNARGDYSNDERSYLRSPCFDFSGLTTDPYLSFLLYVDTEVNFDQLYLESSTDDGRTWNRVQRNPTGINWYNNARDQAWDGDGGFGGGYALAGQQLAGLAGEEQVQLRFVFRSDGDGTREGIAIDNIRIVEQTGVDLAAVSAQLPGFDGCGNGMDTLRFVFADIGTQRVDSARVSYRANGGETISAMAAGPSTRGGRMSYSFVTDLTVTPPDSVRIEAWVTVPDDVAAGNDTTTLVFQPTRALPFLVDFENGRKPTGWLLDDDLVVARRADTATVTLSDNLFDQDTSARVVTAYYGPFLSGDSLTFDLGVSGEDASARLTVMAEVACDSSLVSLLDTEVTAARRIAIGLDQLDGDAARFIIRVTRMSGDFFVDFDNLSVRRCPASLDIRLTTVPPSGIYADDGLAYLEVRAGLAPYTYQWSTGDTTASADSLSVADYSVTVTDALGCTDTRDVNVDLDAVGTAEASDLLASLEVFPNPTSGRVEIWLELTDAATLGLEVYDARGQRIEQQELGSDRRLSTEINLADRPTGLYFVRVRAGAAARTIRVVKQ